MTHIVCQLSVKDEAATYRWSEGPAYFDPYTLDGPVYLDLQESAEEVRERLSDLVKDYLYDEENLGNAAYELAQTGYELYQQMFDPGAAQARDARGIRKWLEELRDHDAVESLEIVVESPWAMPLNVIYDEAPDQQAFLDKDPNAWKPFWGIRYNLAAGRKVDPLRRTPRVKTSKILLVIDDDIKRGLPPEQQQRLDEFVQSHDLTVVRSSDELVAKLNEGRPELLYWLSHADPSTLTLGKDKISPKQLRRLLRSDDEDDPYKLGGLAFLNACQTAEKADRGSSFFEVLHSVGFSGMVGTEHQTIDTFANPLGIDFLEAFLDCGESVGEILHKLRSRVPLGLLYGAYCPPNIRVATSDAVADQIQVTQTPRTEGVALGTGAAVAAPLLDLPDQPYRSLDYYDRQDRALFAGRDDDVERFATVLDAADTRMLVLHGESGVGKSSFLRAGVIPYLEEDCLGYRFMRQHEDRQGMDPDDEGSILFIRATNDPFGQLADALIGYCARPYEYATPSGDSVSIDLQAILTETSGVAPDAVALAGAMRNDSSLLAKLLTALSWRLPHTIVLVIDQCEEIFTLAHRDEDFETCRLALAMLRHTVGVSGDFRIILSLRTEYYGRLIDRLRRGLIDSGSIREYLLTDFDEDGLIEAITRPTSEQAIPGYSEVPLDKYGFRYADGVAEHLAREVLRFSTDLRSQRRDSVLPLLQVACTQLYEACLQRTDRVIFWEDVQHLGGIEGGLQRHVENLLNRLVGEERQDRTATQQLFTQLFLRQPDGSLTTALLAEDDLRERWHGRMPFARLLDSAQASRLLRVNSLRIGEAEQRYVSLGHDSLAKIAADWDQKLSQRARLFKVAGILGSVAGVAGVIALLSLWALAATKRELAAKRNEVAAEIQAREAVDAWLIEHSGDLEFYPGLRDQRMELLELAQEQFSTRTAQVPSTATPKNLNRREYDRIKRLEKGRSLIRLGDVHNQLGRMRLEEQTELATEHFLAAEEAARKASAMLANGRGAASRLELANSHITLGLVLTQKMMVEEDAKSTLLQEAETAFNEADAIIQQLPTESSDILEYRNAKARRLLGHAQLLATAERWSDAEVAARDAVIEFQKLSELDSSSVKYQSNLATALTQLSDALKQQQRYADAVPVLEKTIDAYDKAIEKNPSRADYYAARIDKRHDLIAAMTALDRKTAAKDQYGTLFADYGHWQRELVPDDYFKNRADLGRAYGDFAKLLTQLGRNQEALQARQNAISEYEVLVQVCSPDDKLLPKYHRNLADARWKLVEDLRQIGRDDGRDRQTLETLKAAISFCEGRQRGAAPHREGIAAVRLRHSKLMYRLGACMAARQQAEVALRTINELTEKDPTSAELLDLQADALLTFAKILVELNEHDLAAKFFDRAHGTFEKLVSDVSEETRYLEGLAWCRCDFGLALMAMNNHDAAHQMFTLARADFQQVRQRSGSMSSVCRDGLARTYTGLGDLYASAGKRDEARHAYAKAIELREELQGSPGHLMHLAMLLINRDAAELQDTERAIRHAKDATLRVSDNARYWSGLGSVYYAAGRYDDAIAAVNQAIKLRLHPDSRDQFYLALAHAQLKRGKVAAEFHQQAIQILQQNRPGNAERLRLQKESDQLLARDDRSDADTN